MHSIMVKTSLVGIMHNYVKPFLTQAYHTYIFLKGFSELSRKQLHVHASFIKQIKKFKVVSSAYDVLVICLK